MFNIELRWSKQGFQGRAIIADIKKEGVIQKILE